MYKLFRKLLPVIMLFALVINSDGATATKGLIGEQDINRYTGTGGNTFTRPSSTGGTQTLNKVGYEVDALISYGGGTSFTQATIEAALTAIGTANKVTLLLRPGNWVILTALAFPTNVILKMPAGSYFSGAAVTAGTITITSGQQVYPEWFGAKSDGTETVATTIAIQAAIAAATPTIPGNPWDLNTNAHGGIVKLSGGKYSITSISIPSWVTVKGDGMARTMLVSTATSGAIISLGTLATPAYNNGLEDISIDGQSNNISGVSMWTVYWQLRNVSVYHCNYNGFYMYDSYSGNAYNIYSRYNATTSSYAGIYMTGSGADSGENAVSIFGGDVQGNYDNIYVGVGYSVNLNNITIQSAKRHGINIGATPDAVNIIRCYFEDNAHDYAGANIWGNLTRTTIEGNFFGTMGTNATKLIAATVINGAKITGNILPVIAAPKAFIGMTDETVLEPAYTFIRAYIAGNSGPDDSSPLFTSALEVIIVAKELAGGVSTNYINHLGKTWANMQFVGKVYTPYGTYTGTLTPGTSGTITLDSAQNTLAWTKNGNIIHVQGMLVVDSVSSPVGTVVKVNLPYAAAAGTERSARVSGGLYNSNSGLLPWTIFESDTVANIIMTAAGVAGTHQFYIGLDYMADH